MNGQSMCKKCMQKLKIYNMMRNLWEQHIFWTYNYISSTVQNLPDAKYIGQRLLRNPDDFEKVLVQFYSKNISSLFASLLREHLMLAQDMLKASISDNFFETEKFRRQWYQNAENISIFLSEINPYWKRETWRNMLFEHLKLVEKMVDASLSENHKEKVFMFDDMEKQALAMADYMTEGIHSQF